MEGGEVRLRRGFSHGSTVTAPVVSTNLSVPVRAASSATQRACGWPLLVILLVMMAVAQLLMQRLNQQLPAPGRLEQAATQYLLPLVRLGPRPVGSHANEVLAVNMILGYLNEIKSQAKPQYRLDIDHQIVSGSFRMGSLDGVTSQYAHVQNIVARLSPAASSSSSASSDHALLVNCHFDSAIDSPGASDDLVSCATMLAVLQSLSVDANLPLRHSIIFLFNGAEENMLQASHGFITQHKWARSIRAFINLEAAGAGGREMVFQVGPGHPWLAKAYSESVPHPFANIVGQEIFQSGIIPSDTDFRIFRDYGRIPGLDTAFISNGYVYHTPFDNEQQLTVGSMQRAGDNVRALLVRLATTDLIVSATSQDVGAVVFLDMFGMFMVVIDGWINSLLCVTMVAVVLWTALRSLRYHKLGVCHMMGAVCVLLMSWVLAITACLALAYLLDHCHATMSWYSVPAWLVLIYSSCFVAVVVLIQNTLLPLILPKDRAGWISEAALYESGRVLLSLVMAACVWLGLGSSLVLFMLLLTPTLLRNCLLHCTLRVHSGRALVLVHLAGQMLPLCLVLYAASFTLDFFVPIMGRVGSAVNPELLISVIVSIFTLLATMFLTPLVSLTDCGRRVGCLLVVIATVSVAMVTLTPAGFPYSTQRPNIRAQRVWIQHTRRVFHDDTGVVSHSDGGLMLWNLDRNGRYSGVGDVLATSTPSVVTPHHTELDCDQLLYCGISYYYPNRRGNYMNNYYVSEAAVHFSSALKYGSRVEIRGNNTWRIHLNFTGSDHMTVQLCARQGVNVTSWSLADGRPLPSGVLFQQTRPTYFLYYSWGQRPAPWTFSVDLHLNNPGDMLDRAGRLQRPLLDVVANSHHLHGPDSSSSQLEAVVARLPLWVVPITFKSQHHAFSVPAVRR